MVIILMGVTGCGKTTVGRRLADRCGLEFVEGDDLHPPDNVRKMATGTPLDDADRQPWLEAIGRRIDRAAAEGRPLAVSCSALKTSYRRTLAGDVPAGRLSGDGAAGRGAVRFVYLRATRELIAARLAGRRDHFMPPGLIDSQFAALEEPGEGEAALAVDASADVDAIVERIVHEFGLRDGPDT